MGERTSSLFAKLTLKSKRQLATAPSNGAAAASSSSSSSARFACSPVTTPETELPTSFSGQADYGLGYSSIHHERSPSYKGKRSSRANLPRSIEFDRYAELESNPVQPQSPRLTHARSRSRSKKLNLIHPEEDPLFVEIVDGAAPTPTIQSTVRAQSRAGTSPPGYAAVDLVRPQSPFTISRSGSQSHSSRPPTRISPRRCHSAADRDAVHGLRSVPIVPLAHSAAQLDETPPQSYYVVARGWKKGIYTSKEDAERQTRNFPGPLIQEFRDRAAAESFLANLDRLATQPSSCDESDEEFMERTRIFKGLDPSSDLAKRRSISMSAERRQAQRMSRLLIATHSPLRGHSSTFAAATAAVDSPPLSLHSMFSDTTPISPIEELGGGFGSMTNGMTLLPVTHLASAMTFYAQILDFICVSHEPGLQAVMSSPAATVCLRTIGPASPSSHETGMHNKSNASTGSVPFANGRTAPPTVSRMRSDRTNLALPPTPESPRLSCKDPEPLDLPPGSIPLSQANSAWSAATVLIEHDGALEAMHSRLTAKFNQWRIEHGQDAQCTQRPAHSAKLLGGVRQTSWDAQELHLCDLDGHRIIYTTPLCRGNPDKSLF